MSDKPAWMEEWRVRNGPDCEDHVVCDELRTENRGNWLLDPAQPSHPNMSARIRLAAAAPQLVRALLLVEWAEDQDGSGLPQEFCPACNGLAPSRSKWLGIGHRAACPLDAALTVAGLGTQESRDEARKLMVASK